MRLKEKMAAYKGRLEERNEDRRELNDSILFSVETKLDLLSKLDR